LLCRTKNPHANRFEELDILFKIKWFCSIILTLTSWQCSISRMRMF
jgi:hypothetical protein